MASCLNPVYLPHGRGPAKNANKSARRHNSRRTLQEVGGTVYRNTKGLGTSVAVLIQTLFSCMYSLIISAPFSFPMPLRL